MWLNTHGMQQLGCLTGDVLGHLQSLLLLSSLRFRAPSSSTLPSHFQIKHVFINLWLSWVNPEVSTGKSQPFHTSFFAADKKGRHNLGFVAQGQGVRKLQPRCLPSHSVPEVTAWCLAWVFQPCNTRLPVREVKMEKFCKTGWSLKVMICNYQKTHPSNSLYGNNILSLGKSRTLSMPGTLSTVMMWVKGLVLIKLQKPPLKRQHEKARTVQV